MRKLAGCLAAVLLLCCAVPLTKAGVAVPPDPDVKVEEEKQPDPTPPPERVDPFLDKLERFEDAYAELTCKANPDIDPTSPIATVRCPYQRLEQLVGEQTLTLEVYLRILKRHGFESADEFFKAKTYIDKVRPGWFDGLKNQLLDFVEECE